MQETSDTEKSHVVEPTHVLCRNHVSYISCRQPFPRSEKLRAISFYFLSSRRTCRFPINLKAVPLSAHLISFNYGMHGSIRTILFILVHLSGGISFFFVVYCHRRGHDLAIQKLNKKVIRPWIPWLYIIIIISLTHSSWQT